MSLKNKIRISAITDPGMVREHNEDSIQSNGDIALMVLADGMGGYNAGEVASEIAVTTIGKMVEAGITREARNDIDSESGLMRQTIVLRDAIARANKIIHQTAQSKSECEGMGTTIVAMLFFDDRVSIAHVGDSRAYRMRDNRFEQLTLDHSLLQELVDRGFYSPEEAQRSTNRNYVTRALGVETTVDVEIQEDVVKKGDVYLMCSDGLPDMVEDEDIHLTISTFSASLDVVAQQLVQLSNDHGGRDNISIMLAEIVTAFPARKGLVQRITGLFR